MFTDISTDIIGYIQDIGKSRKLIFGFADCCTHSDEPTKIKIGFSRKRNPKCHNSVFYLPSYIYGVPPQYPFEHGHPLSAYDGIVLRVIFDSPEEDIHGLNFNGQNFRRLRFRLDTRIYANRNQLFI